MLKLNKLVCVREGDFNFYSVWLFGLMGYFLRDGMNLFGMISNKGYNI